MNEISALLIASPGRRRDSLGVLLKAVPTITALTVVDIGPDSLTLAHRLQPELILLDVEGPESAVWNTLARLRQEVPQSRYWLLVNTGREAVQAGMQGADEILLPGFSSETIGVMLTAVQTEHIYP